MLPCRGSQGAAHAGARRRRTALKDSSSPTTLRGRLAANRWVLLAVISIGTLMSTLDGGVVGVSYPAVAEAFDTDTSTVLWINVAFWVTSVGLLLTLGWLGDVAGRRRVFIIGYLVSTVGILLCSASGNIWQLIAFRVLQGVGSSMVLSNLNALIAAEFPPGERGRAMGISGAVVGVGLTTGPLMGGILLDALDWRALFYVRAPIGALGALLAWWLLPAATPTGGRFRMDYMGAAALFATMTCFLLVVNQGGRLGYGSPPILALGAAVLVLAPTLVWTQRRAVRPILEFALFRSRGYAAGLAIVLGHYLAHGPILLVAPFFFIDALGFSESKMGLFVAGFFIGRAFLAPVAGLLSDRFGPRGPLVFGNGMLMASLLWLSTLGTGAGEPVILAAMILGGMGSAFFEPVVTSVVMGSVPVSRLGTASASVAMGRHIAFSVGVAVAGAIFTIRERFYLGEAAQASEAIAGAFSDSLVAGAVFAAMAVTASLFTPSLERIGRSTAGANPADA